MWHLDYTKYNYSLLLNLFCLLNFGKIKGTLSFPKFVQRESIQNALQMEPTEVLPILPVLIYPIEDRSVHQTRKSGKENEKIIYISLLSPKLAYRPKQNLAIEKNRMKPKIVDLNDIIFVKSPANGMFNHKQLQIYRLPEFFAINVFRNGMEV